MNIQICIQRVIFLLYILFVVIAVCIGDGGVDRTFDEELSCASRVFLGSNAEERIHQMAWVTKQGATI